MRKVIFAMNISIDGCYEHTEFAPDEELMEYFIQLMKDIGTIVYGRKTYELMIPYWPDVARSRKGRPDDIAFADAMAPIEKYVMSRTLKNAEENTKIVREDPAGLIRELKQQPGKQIALSSTSMLPCLLEQGLIDELYLIVYPYLVGKKKRLFNEFLVNEMLKFSLEYTRQYKSGVIILQYRKVG